MDNSSGPGHHTGIVLHVDCGDLRGRCVTTKEYKGNSQHATVISVEGNKALITIH